MDILAETDQAFAWGEFSRQFDCCIAEVVPERAICLNCFPQPLLLFALSSGHSLVIHFDLELKAPKSLMIISGP